MASWTRSWRLKSSKAVTCVSFDGTGRRFTATFSQDPTVFVWTIEAEKRPKLRNRLRHSRAVVKVSWRGAPEDQSHADVLITTTCDGVVRLWMAVIDEPDCYRLWSATDAASFDSSRRRATGAKGQQRPCIYLDARRSTSTMRRSLDLLLRDIQMAETGVGSDRIDLTEKTVDLKRSRARRLEQFISETPDMFLHVNQEGILGVRALAGVDRRPPTLCECFTALKIPAPDLVQSEAMQDIDLLTLTIPPSADCDSPTGLMRIEGGEKGGIADFQLSPALLFDGQGEGLTSKRPSGSVGHLDAISSLSCSGDTLFSFSRSGRAIRWSPHGSQKEEFSHFIAAPLGKVAMRGNRCVLESQDGEVFAGEFGKRLLKLDGLPAGLKVQDLGWTSISDKVLALISTTSGEVFAWKGEEPNLQRVQLNGREGNKALAFVDGRNSDTVLTIDSQSLDVWTVTTEKSGLCLRLQKSIKGTGHLQLATFEHDQNLAALVDGSLIVVHDLASRSSDTIKPTGEVVAMGWSPDTSNGPLLAVASRTSADIYCRARNDLLGARGGANSRWRLSAQIDLSSANAAPITSLVWLSDFQLVIASSNQLYSFGPLMNDQEKKSLHLAQLAASKLGPLPEYHPQVLSGCLLIGRLDLARHILAHALKNDEPLDGSWACLKKPVIGASGIDASGDLDHLAALQLEDKREFRAISRAIIDVDELQMPLDDEGLRYLVTLKWRLASLSDIDTPWRDVIFAFHSKRQELLVQVLDRWYNSKIDWPTARSIGLFMWLRSNDDVRAQAELVARCQYTKGEDRDPSACSILYFALGKQKLVLGLWKQAYWHPDQKKMLQFLANDFTQDRWRSAALKNAFALLSQRRFGEWQFQLLAFNWAVS